MSLPLLSNSPAERKPRAQAILESDTLTEKKIALYMYEYMNCFPCFKARNLTTSLQVGFISYFVLDNVGERREAEGKRGKTQWEWEGFTNLFITEW